MSRKYKYLKDPYNPKRIMTLVTEIIDGLIYCGWSISNPADQFNKKLGRTIAEGRLEKNIRENKHIYHYCSQQNSIDTVLWCSHRAVFPIPALTGMPHCGQQILIYHNISREMKLNHERLRRALASCW